MPRMRTAAGLLDEIRASDPNTMVTIWFLRRLINSGVVPVITLGKKKLVDLDAVLAVMQNGIPDNGVPDIREVEKDKTGKIRRIDL